MIQTASMVVSIIYYNAQNLFFSLAHIFLIKPDEIQLSHSYKATPSAVKKWPCKRGGLS